MKYYSEKLGKVFPTEKECLQAEAKHDKETADKKLAEQQKNAEISKRKKELSKAIDIACDKVTEANKLYEVAKARAREILEQSTKEMNEILEVAEKQVKDAEREKLAAMQNWNKEFGTYSKTYTGAQALEEFEKSLARFNTIFNHFWF